MKWPILIIFFSILHSANASDLVEAVKSLNEVQAALKLENSTEKYCSICTSETYTQKHELLTEEIDIGKMPIYQSNRPYVLRITRTHKSPKKFSIKYENGQDECLKDAMGINPYTKQFEYFGCMLYTMRFVPEEMDINLEGLKKLNEGESEIIDIVLTKKNSRKYPYDVLVERPMGEKLNSKISTKFFGNGKNIKLREIEEGKP